MRVGNRLLNLVLLATLFTASNLLATTYYIDYASGSDSNNGRAKTTAFKNIPGSGACNSTCASTTPRPGDSFILRGGVTWPNAALGINWIWSGNATTSSPGCAGAGCIYIGVDQTWYSGSAWTRPILSGGGSVVNTPPNGVANTILRLYANYVIVDNIEFTGLFWNASTRGGTNLELAGGTPGVGTNVTLESIYIHGWSHGTAGSGTTETPCGVNGDTSNPNNNVNSILINSVIDGSDTDKQSCSAIFGGPPYIQHNFIQWVTSGAIIDGTVSFDGNTILHVPASFDNSAHTNGVEVNYSQNMTLSNNLIAHLGSGTLGIWLAPDSGYTATAFNNVVYDTDTTNVIDLAAPVDGGNGGTDNLYNNTVECGPDSNPNAVCAAGINSRVAAVTLENNHFITNAGNYWGTNGVTPTLITNLLQTSSSASSQGYTSNEVYPFTPTSPSDGTVGAGTNMTSKCSSFPTLCGDAAVGVAYNAANHTVSYPNRPINGRPSSGNWDIGAYLYGSFPPPGPPSNLIAMPQ
jgi:hypothetical protein